jgi:hypothetical protein
MDQFYDIILGILAGGIIWQVLNVVYMHFKIGKLMKDNGYGLGKFLGSYVWKYGIRHVKDQELQQTSINDLDAMGDEIDKGWDDGIRGL